MYTLHCYPGSRATAAHMVLAEAGLPHEIREVDFLGNAHVEPEFFAINPRGTIPAMVDAEHGVTVCETIAIMLYLTDKHGLESLAPGPTDPMRGVLLDWLVYHATEVQEPVKRSAYAHRHADTPQGEAEVRKRATALFTRRWRLVEEHLERAGPFHLGERFSLVDIYLLVSSAYSMDLAEGKFPAIEACMQRTAERPGIAPINARHLAGLAHVMDVGVPR